MPRIVSDDDGCDSAECGCSASAAIDADRRDLLIGCAALVAGATVLLPEDLAAAKPAGPDRSPPQPGDRFQVVRGPLKNEFLRPEMLETGAPPLEGFPFDPVGKVLRRKNRLNRVLMLRLDPQEMDEPTRARSAEGVLVYSAVCTHRSCTIKSWKAEERHLRCHCHLSEFAALSEGSVKNGPAKRQLPMVPLGLDADGFIVGLDGFTRKPGGAKK